MPILINVYRERYESHDPGDDICEADSRWTEEENAPYTFRELVDRIRNHGNGMETSSYPTDGSIYDWVTQFETNNGTRDYYETGATEHDTIHYSRDNLPRYAKYWKWAFRAAGFRVV